MSYKVKYSKAENLQFNSQEPKIIQLKMDKGSEFIVI